MSDTDRFSQNTRDRLRQLKLFSALEDEALIAWAMNGEDIPHMNGYPLRLVIGGWPGSVA